MSASSSTLTAPPRRTARSSSLAPSPPDPAQATWSTRMKATGSIWGKKAIDKSVQWSDNIGGRVNTVAERKFGTEHFWPVTGDFGREMDKAARILRAFTVNGVVTEEKDEEKTEVVEEDEAGKKTEKKKKVKVIRKIPPTVIAQAKGLAIFTCMRTGFAPFGGAGGAGVVVAKLPDGYVYDCVLVIRSQKALDSFATHKATLGAEIGVAAGPYGGGAAMETGIEKAPVFSYVRSRGMYAGVEVVGQVFVERFEENAAMYHWPGVKAGDILGGKVRAPREAAGLHRALRDAETGRAQREKGEALDIVVPEGADLPDLEEGETLKLPPTPDMTDGSEHQSDPETEKVHYSSRPVSQSSSSTDLKMLPPPRHPRSDSSSMIPPARHSGSVQAPPLPTRSRQRPVLVEHSSSTSHYSDALDVDARGSAATPSTSPQPHTATSHDDELAPTIPPPSYAQEHEVPLAPLPSQKQTHALAENEGEDPMSESERREWEQFLAEQKEDEARRGVQVSSGGETDVLSQRLVGQRLDGGEGSR